MSLKKQAVVRFPQTGLLLAIIAVLLAMAAGFGSRWGWWNFRTGFSMLRWAANVGLAGAAVSIAGLILSWRTPGGRRLPAFLGIIIAIVLVGILWSWWRTAQTVPAIHDISTDTERPPPFVSVLSFRKDAPNPAEYGGPDIAARQRAAYPDLAPAALSLPPDQAFNRALQAARVMGWTIVDSNPAEGRIEATDTTFWFGFKDDVVIRVMRADNGSRVDVRSVSRVGRSDVGTNAKRIRKYLEKLKEGG